MHTRSSLENYLQKAAKKAVLLIVTDNSSSIISVRTENMKTVVRLHRMFLNAGDDVLNEISVFISDRKVRTPLIRDFIRQHMDLIKPGPKKKLKLKTQGKYHNILEIFRSINNEYFGDEVSAAITWGTKKVKYAVRRRTLGSYSMNTNTIRINPFLDKRYVPQYFLEFIIYHEMLHAFIGIGNKNGRRSVHSKEFRQRERQFRDYEKATAWERKWLFS
ncbi:MAG: SprT-like domain-containing protein [Nitrospirota bacterium]